MEKYGYGQRETGWLQNCLFLEQERYRGEPLLSGETYISATQTIRIPHVASGTYYLLLKTDINNSLYESNEDNNLFAKEVTIKVPDLIPISMNAPSSASTQQDIEVLWTIKNQGDGQAIGRWWWEQQGWHDNLYLSTDNQLNEGDTHLATYYRGEPLLSGETYISATQTIRIPHVASGTYYLLLKTDINNSLYESNEDNNLFAKEVTIKVPDLIPISMNAPSSASTQQDIEVLWTIKNQGDGQAIGRWWWEQQGWHDNLYLSTDNQLNEGDTHLATYYRGEPLLSGESYIANAKMKLPGVSAGDYYILVKTDNRGVVYETDESNNILTGGTITLKNPDLTVISITVPQTASIQQAIAASWVVKNQGKGDSYVGWHDGIYLSTDDKLDEADLYIVQNFYYGPLLSNATYTKTTGVTIPQVPIGDYYLIVKTDRDNYLYESDEINNTLSRKITVVLTQVTGRVIDEFDNPVENATVYIGNEFRRTDSNGSYTFLYRPPGTYTVTVSPLSGSGLLSKQITGILVTEGKTTVLNIVLVLGGIITGKVTDESGNYVANVRVRADREGGDYGSVYTDSSGNYTILGLLTGTYTIWVSPPTGSGLVFKQLTGISVTEGKVTTLNIVLPPEGKITGKVTDESGNPVVNAQLNVNREGGGGWGSAQTDLNGNYTIRGLAEGTYTIRVYPPQGSVLALQQVTGISVTQGEMTTLAFILPPAGIITGRVIDEQGNSVANAWVNTWQPLSGSRGNYTISNSGVTDPSGKYTIFGLPEGTYELEVFPQENHLARLHHPPFSVQRGKTTTINLVIPKAGFLKCIVNDNLNNPVFNSWINAALQTAEGYNYGGLNDWQGNYFFKIPPGTYTVSVCSPSGSNLISQEKRDIQVITEETTIIKFILSTETGKPIINSISPNSSVNSGTVNVTIKGSNFQPGAAVKLTKAGQPDIVGTNTTIADSVMITTIFDLTDKEAGGWDVVVINPDGKSGTLSKGFTIRSFEAENILRRVEENYALIEDMKMDYTYYSIYNSKPFGPTFYAKYWLKKPDKNKIEIFLSSDRATKTDAVVTNNNIVYLIDFVKNKQQEVDLLENSGMTPVQLNQVDFYYHLDEFLANHNIIKKESYPEDGRLVYVVEAIPKAVNDMYSKLELHIDYDRGLLKKQKLFKEGKLAETIITESSHFIANKAWVPTKLITIPSLTSSKFQTIMIYENIEINIGVSDDEFTP